jgi:hypothetical protein
MDRDWDFHYIVVLLLHKLQRTEKALLEDAKQGIGNVEDLRHLHIAVLLLQRITKDEYYHNQLDAFEQEFKHTVEYFFIPVPGDGEYSTMESKWIPPIEDVNYSNMLKKLRMQCSVRGDNQQKQDWVQLWSIISKHGQKWWS